MNINEAIKNLKENSIEVPAPSRLPDNIELSEIENELKFKFSDEFREYQLHASNLVVGVLEPGRALRDAQKYINLINIANNGWALGIKKDLLPFCNYNGNYYCINTLNEIFYWDHEDNSIQKRADSFSEFIVEEWIENYVF